MRNILLSAGHSNKVGRDRGAVGNGYIEGELAVEFRELLECDLKNEGIDITKDANDTILSETIKAFSPISKDDDILIDIHWNSATPSATGVEVLVPENCNDFELKLAKRIADCISQTLNIQLRGNYKNMKGVRSETESQYKKLGFMRLKGNTILIEMCFISNKNDMESYQNNKEILSFKIASILKEFKNLKINNDTNLDKITYVVKNGDTLSKIASLYKVSVNYIKEKNNLTKDTIYVGQKLYI